MRRPVVSGKAGLIVLAAAAIPVAIAQFKPAAKKLGEKMVEWGEKLQRDAQEAKPASNGDMKTSRSSHEQHASPTGKEEVKAQQATKDAGTVKPPARKKTIKKTEPTTKPGKTNPKDAGR
ncbi:MAG TPA: hypothetical protein VJ835_10285 [Fimbriimonadaceae bacterium]|nr:hypothetical protein [Fimbriimonadaceae bacterium]